jgi:hypothetical protein
MNKKNIDERVLADLRQWIGVSAEKVSDDDLWNNSASVRARLVLHYALKDFSAACMEAAKDIASSFEKVSLKLKR